MNFAHEIVGKQRLEISRFLGNYIANLKMSLDLKAIWQLERLANPQVSKLTQVGSRLQKLCSPQREQAS